MTSSTSLQQVRVIDSHTGGEPTRLVIAGGPELGTGDMAARLANFRDFHDEFRSAVVNEPRGSDAVVGALLCSPVNPENAAGVIFFNNVGYLGMCVHGTIGVAATLAHMGRIGPGAHRLETPVGDVVATLHDDGRVTVRNVPSYRLATNVTVAGAKFGRVTGDISWAGNWFFLVPDCAEEIAYRNIEKLTELAWNIRLALRENNITGAGGAEIDHIELFGPPSSSNADSKNFVLCPGKAYDRSPCGTGTSAKIACLVSDGKLKPGEVWRQESIVGSIFAASAEIIDGQIIPSITGDAFVTGEATLLFDARDPFRTGIRG